MNKIKKIDNQLEKAMEELERYIKEEMNEGKKRTKDFREVGLDDYLTGKLSAYKKVLDRINELEDDYL